ncbi:uncharacterized protein N7477_006871 [Penicillium maclennaniae]|uniref:uncharacterized protein n=1 Tax=Penicillium maclennaniae TaxID=1343394 RepID=UPI00253FAA50|nr:uncharacterized protein N7477_006871 [Penicillium maclennaniae]KAJ5668301.1 hypothetical protein N7477_006871 [Penicillium maclennaniae]
MTPPAKNNDFAGIGAWATLPKGGPSPTLSVGSLTSASSTSSGGKSQQGSFPHARSLRKFAHYLAVVVAPEGHR